MFRIVLPLISLVAAGCVSLTVGVQNGGDGGTSSGGASTYTVVPVNTSPFVVPEFAMAIGPSDQVGVAYFFDGGLEGVGIMGVIYSEVQDGGASTPDQINATSIAFGITLAFQPSGEPAVGYVGGLGNGNEQTQAELDYRLGPGNWTRDVCMLSSAGGSCEAGSPACTTNGASLGEMVGAWPSLVFDGGTAIMAFQDNSVSTSVDMCIGGPGGSEWAWTEAVSPSNNAQVGRGGHNQLLLVDGLLAEISDDGFAQDLGRGPIVFTRQTQSAQSKLTWSAPIDPFDPQATGNSIANTGTGPSMAYSSGFGLGVATTDLQASPMMEQPALYFVYSTDEGATWSERETVFHSGSGGFFPALQINPNTGNPIVSYTICSLSVDRDPANFSDGCDSAAELDTAERTDAGWVTTTELKGNFWHPLFGYLSTGKRVFAYYDLDHGGLFVAIQN